jgi:hypothetical protein
MNTSSEDDSIFRAKFMANVTSYALTIIDIEPAYVDCSSRQALSQTRQPTHFFLSIFGNFVTNLPIGMHRKHRSNLSREREFFRLDFISDNLVISY